MIDKIGIARKTESDSEITLAESQSHPTLAEIEAGLMGTLALETTVSAMAAEVTANEALRAADKADLDAQLSTAAASLLDLVDEAFGKWDLNFTTNLLTLYRQDGTTVLKTFDLTEAVADAKVYVKRTPQ